MFSRISLRGEVVHQMHDAICITHVGAPGPEPFHHHIPQGEEEEKEEGGGGQVNQIRSNFGESSEEDVRKQTHKKIRKPGDKRSTERDSRGADCVRSLGAFWQPNTLLPWPADKECGGCARKSAEKVREVKFEFFLVFIFFSR